jgi:PTH1 family peptidyl-tRNA hydrolase
VKLVVGLGNPGRRYRATRHNVGFRIVEHFAASRGIALREQRFESRFGRGRVPGAGGAFLDVGILEPQTWMNHSGRAVAEALGALPVDDPAEDLLVVLDDVDLPFGRLRVRPAGGAGGHRGLADVIEVLGRRDLPRLRFGVGRSGIPMETSDWVLQPFSEQEEAELPGRISTAAQALATALVEGVPAAMNRFNPEPASVSGEAVQ